MMLFIVFSGPLDSRAVKAHPNSGLFQNLQMNSSLVHCSVNAEKLSMNKGEEKNRKENMTSALCMGQTYHCLPRKNIPNHRTGMSLIR